MYFGESSTLSTTREQRKSMQYLAILLVLACYYDLYIGR